MRGYHWMLETNGTLTANVDPFSLKVAMMSGFARYLLHQRDASQPGEVRYNLVASGVRPDVPTAIDAAEAAAKRMAAN